MLEVGVAMSLPSHVMASAYELGPEFVDQDITTNDKQTVQWTQPKEWAGSPDFAKRVLAPGTVALQAHDPNSTVYYKNIRIKPL